MKPVTALIFAFAGVFMLVGVGFSLSERSIALGVSFFVGFVAVTACGFVFKARQRKKMNLSSSR